MQRYPLGQFSVSRIGFGAMQLPGPGVFGPPRDRGEALAVLRRAVELGVDHMTPRSITGLILPTSSSGRLCAPIRAPWRW